MNWGGVRLEGIYWALFYIGVFMAVATIVFGDFSRLFARNSSYMSSTVISAFLTVFGGTGVLLTILTYASPLIRLLISLAAATVLASAIVFTVTLPLYREQQSVAHIGKEISGKKAVVTVPLGPDVEGEIVYEHRGSRIMAPARSAYDEWIPRGETVWIMDVIGGTFVVVKEGQEEDK